MIKTILTIASFLSWSVADAEQTPIGCLIETYDCHTSSNGTQKCGWGAGLGHVYSIDLEKTGTSPNYEIWEGKLAGSMRRYKFEVSVYQRREAAQKVNYLTANLLVDDKIASGLGENTVEAKYLDTKSNEGMGIRCSMDISPVPQMLDLPL